MSEKTQGEELKERLFDCKKNGWESTSEEEGRKIFRYCDGYINFLSKSKTEREFAKNAKELLDKYKFNYKYPILNILNHSSISFCG